MRRLSITCLVSILAMAPGACATATGDEEIVDAAKPDSGLFVPPDATTKIVDASVTDATISPDATIVPPVDAAIIVPDAEIGGLFCDENNDCASQDCCILSLCVRGTRVGSLCVPD